MMCDGTHVNNCRNGFSFDITVAKHPRQQLQISTTLCSFRGTVYAGDSISQGGVLKALLLHFL